MAPHHSADCPLCKGAAIAGSMSDACFAGFLHQCRLELAEKQGCFVAGQAPGAPWRYDLATSRLTIGAASHLMLVIGSRSRERGTWLWAWANRDFPACVRQASSRSKELFAITGFKVFTDEGVTATRSDAEDLCSMVIHLVGADGLFKVGEAPTLYMAVFTAGADPSTSPPADNGPPPP